ncbi:MAG: hypothetical protein JAY97_04565 [Candidatus Thiodiazotropha sp. 'RUGA']|nr:hypothetical protein [Candidatus Thiodiazotropha sp. 'RUGA']
MKWLLTTLLLPTLALAQPPGQGAGQMDPQQHFAQSKKAMLPLIEKSIPAMQETKSCLNQAKDQAAFQQCVEIMIAVEKEMQAKMGRGPMPGADKAQSQPPKKIEFNEQNKQNMLKFLDQSILVGQSLKNCFTSSQSPDQMQSCMQAAKPKQ